MDSPSLNSSRSPVLSRPEPEPGTVSPPIERTGRASRTGVVVIAGFGNPVAADYAAYVSQNSPRDFVVANDHVRRLMEPSVRSLSLDEFSRSTPDLGRESRLVLFIPARLTKNICDELDEILGIARRSQARFVCIVSTFRYHLDDPRVKEAEDYFVSRATDSSARVIVFRPGHVLSQNSSISLFLDRFAPFFPLVPKRLTSCFIEGTEFFAAIEAERLDDKRRGDSLDPSLSMHKEVTSRTAGRAVGVNNRVYTLLGPNLSWHDMLIGQQAAGPRQVLMTTVSVLLSWLLVGQMIAFAVTLLARRFPFWSQWNVQTLKPRSVREIVALCQRYNFDYAKVVGYNNGVAHFGHRHLGKTIVSTVRCRRLVHMGPNTLKADCGATVRNALDFLAANHQELYVVPNYSYVCLGTAFFVPIHGSSVDFSTIADTIERVVLYDPDTDRVVAAARDDDAFRDHVYNQKSRAVVLRLYLLAKPKAKYFVHRETLWNASANEILSALRDLHATNVEIRQSSATSGKVTVARYYKDKGDTSLPALELPRDSLGRLWDRLEENPITSYLMHALSRHVAWHTELFFTLEEFAIFWRTRDQVPLRKIQLRYLRHDGLPHSPMCDLDRVSADLFVFRWNRSRFLDYLKSTYSHVRTNPGKHSN